jgi:glutathione S-transferase
MRRRRRWTHFVDLPRHRQKDQFIRARNRIRRAAPVLGGRFYTHDYLHGKNGWADAIFLSPSPPLFYNATLRTTRYAYREKVEEAASDASYQLAPDREPDFFKRGHRDPKTKH